MRRQDLSHPNNATRTWMRPFGLQTAAGLQTTARRARPQASRRRGAVLIMVVAVLGILFVSGAALLTVVTFSSRSVDAAKAERESRDAVDAIERLVAMKLRDGFLNADGVPYALTTPLVMHQPGQPNMPCGPATACVLALPTNGEQPGVHPWIDLSEPVEDSSDDLSEFGFVSNLQAALENSPVHHPVVAAKGQYYADRLRVVTSAPATTPGMGGFATGALPLIDPGTGAIEWQHYNDADGDGVLDAVEMTILPGMLPANVHRALADRLRANGSLSDPDRLTVTLRIVPHGSMANVNESHDYLRRIATGYSHVWNPPFQPPEVKSDVLFAGAPYLPSSNEWFLRNRGVLLPLNVQPTRLMENLAAELLAPQASQSTLYATGLDQSLLTDPTLRRWWRYDPVADTATSNAAWRTLMNPAAGQGSYDATHNLTTVSHDDLLMRGWGHPVSGLEMRAWVRSKEPAAGASYTPADRFAIDNYPMNLDGHEDPRLGRMKVSFPELDAMWSSGPAGPQRVIQTLRDAFTLLLFNRAVLDLDGDGSVDGDDPALMEWAKPVIAAMLAANMVDYVDIDDTPSPVVVVSTNGLPVVNPESGEPLIAYGFERQPYITEIYTKVVTSNTSTPAAWLVGKADSVFAVELYNPYDSELVLDGYILVDLFAEDVAGSPDTNLRDETAGLLKRFDNSVVLDGIRIPGGDPAVLPLDHQSRFVVICGYGAGCPDNGSNTGNAIGDLAIDNKSVIALKRTVVHPINGSNITIIVDQMHASDSDAATVRRGESAPAPGTFAPAPDPDIGVNPEVVGAAYEVSLQRDTSVPFWRFTVPKATKLFDPVEQTIGAANHANAVSTDEPIYPVHIDIAKTDNNGMFTFAFPTVGSMLLLCRMAHIYDATPYDTTGGTNASMISPFNRVSPELLGRFQDAAGNDRERNIVGQFDQIDNGRLPVFDVLPSVGPARERNVPAPLLGLVEGRDVLPWGQLVFDYFTAVPYFDLGPPVQCDSTAPQSPPAVFMQNCYGRQYPRVDQDGLRVHGRININAASWKVLSGLPMLQETMFPRAYQSDIDAGLRAVRPTQGVLGADLAKSLVAYREGRRLWEGGLVPDAYNDDRDPYGGGGHASIYRPRRGYGFLTIGELLDIRHSRITVAAQRMDALATGTIDPAEVPMNDPRARFEYAIANIVALDDNWVTTKSHVFTVYGVIRGAHEPFPDEAIETPAEYTRKLRSFRDADQAAIRFQSTLDRLPMLFGARQPERIGSRIMGGLVDERSE